MDETQLLCQNDKLTSQIQKLTDQNSNLQAKIEMEKAQKSNLDVSILKLKEQLENTTKESSKQMVASNQNAKVKHFSQVKMDLNIQIQEKAKLAEQLRQKEKKDEANL